MLIVLASWQGDASISTFSYNTIRPSSLRSIKTRPISCHPTASKQDTSTASTAQCTDYTVHASPIHGRGMFAARAFKAGETTIREPIAIEVPKHPDGFDGTSEDFPTDIWNACQAARPETTRRLIDLTASTDPKAIRWIERNFDCNPPPWRSGRPEDVVSKFINNSSAMRGLNGLRWRYRGLIMPARRTRRLRGKATSKSSRR